MGLGDVTQKSAPKMVLVSPPAKGGEIRTHSYIPHRSHAAIGVFGAVTVAVARTLPEGPAADCARLPEGDTFAIEHPSGAAEVLLIRDGSGVLGAGTLRTARKLAEGQVFPAAD